MTTVTILMVHFPLVIVGLGQMLITGTAPANRALQGAANMRTRGTVHANFLGRRTSQGEVVEKRATAGLPRI